MKKFIKVTLIMAVMMFVFASSAYAKNYTKEGTFVWKTADGLFYAYDALTGELIRNQKVGRCYVNENGTRYLNCFVDGVYYNASGMARKKFTSGWVKTGGKFYYFRNQKKLVGYRKINGRRYFLIRTA